MYGGGRLRQGGQRSRESLLQDDGHLVAGALDHLHVAAMTGDEHELLVLGQRARLGRLLRVHLNERLARRSALRARTHATVLHLYILNAVRCPYVRIYTYDERSYVRNGGRGQLSSE